MSRSTECDRCGATETFNLGPRRIAKPTGWGHMIISVKREQGVPSKEYKFDLCPKCTAEVLKGTPE